ncbi:MAG: hypothetical protein Q8P46_15110 [Hyphomicrobiales bacterium]|nr:hypothetical protein [Hyphomicrobiales bacterium]
MPVTYTNAVKAARMSATRTHFAGGSLDIVAASGTILATFKLTAKGGEVNGNVWNMAFESGSVMADATGVPSSAQVKSASGAAGISGLKIGKDGDVALSYAGKGEQKIHAGQDVKLTAAAIFHA